ncbi:MAG: HAD family hydrolase [Gemmataceae bacterium]|nr:HAD family hydrolase [Gemmataceae bacterium]
MALFDAVGTLLFPEPTPGEAYFRAGQRFGGRATREECAARFKAAFEAQEAIDAGNGYRTSEERERERWRAIVGEVLPDVSDAEGCFVHLWDWFADPANWRAAPEAGGALFALRQRGIIVGLASNFDRRLRLIDDVHFGLLTQFTHISSDVGWKKPAREFFDSLPIGLPPHEVLMVGDDLENDYHGARAAGLHAILLDGETTLADFID